MIKKILSIPMNGKRLYIEVKYIQRTFPDKEDLIQSVSYWERGVVKTRRKE